MNLVLREYRSADAERLALLANNIAVSRYLVYTFPNPYTLEDAHWWIGEGSKANGAITRVIEYQGEFVGGIGIGPQVGWKNHIAEIGYWLAEPYWGKGIASAALGKMTQDAFQQFHFEKLCAPVLSPNIASMRVLEKQGYVCEGVLKNEVYKLGRCFDIHHYAKLASSDRFACSKVSRHKVKPV